MEITENKPKKPRGKRGGSGYVCAVYGCYNNSAKVVKWKHSECDIHPGLKHDDCPCLIPYSLHGFPRDEEMKGRWIVALNRKDFTPTKNSKVCSIHFADRMPTAMNPVPELELGYTRKFQIVKHRRRKQNVELAPSPKRIRYEENVIFHQARPVRKKSKRVFWEEVEEEDEEPDEDPTDVVAQALAALQQLPTCNVEIQCNRCFCGLDDHTYSNSTNRPETKSECSQANFTHLRYASLTTKQLLLYTGLSKEIIDNIILIVLQVGIAIVNCKLDVTQQLLLVFMRLRLGLVIEDLADRFQISPSLASKIYRVVIKSLRDHLSKLVYWLPRETIQGCMPAEFKAQRPNTICVLDCIEIFLKHPIRRAHCGHLKIHKSAKFLVAMAPHGYIMFLSPMYGGRSNSKAIVAECGIIDFVEPGDEVMARRKFNVDMELAMRGVSLNVDGFPLTDVKVENGNITVDERFVSARVCVDKLMKRIKSFNILNTVLPFKNETTIEDTVAVIAAMVNLMPAPLNC